MGVAAMAPLTDLSDLVQADRSESDGILLTVLAVATVDEGVSDVPDLGALELGFPVH